MRLPRWIQRMLFGPQPTIQQMLHHMAHGGLNAIETRSASLPPITIFGILSDDHFVIQCFNRHGIDESISDELTWILAKSAKEYLATLSDPNHRAEE